MSAEITNMPYDHKKYEDFMAKWKKESGYEDGNNKHFCEDGPIDANKWEKSKSRIMFLLKESYNNLYDNLKKTAHEKLFLHEEENRYFIDFWHLSYWIISAKVRYKKLRDIMEYIVKSATPIVAKISIFTINK